MTKEEMIKYAQGLLDGGPVKKAEVLAFMRDYLDPDLQAGGPAMTAKEVDAYLAVLPFEIEKTERGIHIPRDVNRFYDKSEAVALVRMIVKALE